MPVGIRVHRRIVGETVYPLAVGVHGVDLAVAVTVAIEGYLVAVRRPVRLPVFSRVVGEVVHPLAVGVHGVDL